MGTYQSTKNSNHAISMSKEKSTEKIDLIDPSQKNAVSDTVVKKEPSPFSAEDTEALSTENGSSEASLLSKSDAHMIDRAATSPIRNQEADLTISVNGESNEQASHDCGVVDEKAAPLESLKTPRSKSIASEKIPEQAILDNTKQSPPTQGEKKNAEKEKIEDEGSSRPQTPVKAPKILATHATHSMGSNSVRSLSPDQKQSSLGTSLHHSPSNSICDDSLFTSMTGATGGKQNDKDLSPLSTYLFDEDIHRRGRSEIVGEADNEVKQFLAQPDLSKLNDQDDTKFRYLDDDVPDDEKDIGAPGIQYISNFAEEAKAPKYGKSARLKRESNNAFSSDNPNRVESGSTPLAQMYDQLAALGQQKKEEKKHSYKRRSKRAGGLDDSFENKPGKNSQENDWGSFLNELAEAEKHFYVPSSSKSQSLLKTNSESEESEDAEIARINNFS